MGIHSILYKLRGEVPTEKLIERGLTVGKNFNRLGGTIIDDSHCWLITIGDNVTLAPRVHILAHDASTKNALGYTRIGLVNIGSNVFVGAESVILPGVTIGNNVVIGSGSIVAKDVEDNSVVAGNPAKKICKYDEYVLRKSEEMKNTVVFNKDYTMNSKEFNDEKKREIIQKLKENKGFGYVE